MRIFECDPSNDLQQFDWDEGDEISLSEFPELCVVFLGDDADLDEDPIFLKECDEVKPKRLRWKAHPSKGFSIRNVKTPTGCMMVEGSGDEDNKLLLATCKSKLKSQKWAYENGMLHTALDKKMRLQAGRKGKPSSGKKMRIFECDSSNELQQFDWSDREKISLSEFPEYCVVFLGWKADLDEDPVFLKLCDEILHRRVEWDMEEV